MSFGRAVNSVGCGFGRAVNSVGRDFGRAVNSVGFSFGRAVKQGFFCVQVSFSSVLMGKTDKQLFFHAVHYWVQVNTDITWVVCQKGWCSEKQ